MPEIEDARILIMATDGFEESELFGPRAILLEQGSEVRLASPTPTPIQATVRDDPGRTIKPDLTIAEARAQDFDALVLPGGVINPDALRTNKFAVELVRAFVAARKPVAAICHGPWLLVEADVLKGRTVTGWKSIRTDLRNAGAKLSDDRVVADGKIITAQAPEDVEAFTAALISAVRS
ncbi:MAG TPA: type 1 glutamine amidotransferase domain-containing protein [Sphingomicrobium sp.]|jgi:protease I|nr:type 1 glutamine amidotransferase domain-containing protein [Sphingomicrobium sp.]